MLAAVRAQSALRDAATAAAEAAERAQSMAAVLDDALANIGALEAKAGRRVATATMPTLSPREREVLALVAEGRTNKAIAEALFVSPNTVKTHVASLLSKLHAESRAQLAAMAVTRTIDRQ